jgi:hypothetical protein
MVRAGREFPDLRLARLSKVGEAFADLAHSISLAISKREPLKIAEVVGKS